MQVDEACRAVVRLPATPDSISTARATVRRALRAWDLDALVDTAQLLTSEVATNAVLHARTDFEVRVERRGDRVRVSVLDGSPRRAARRRYGLDSGTGRGLGLVEALSAAWACEPADGWAKVTWFELDPAATPDSDEGLLYGEDWLSLVDDL